MKDSFMRIKKNVAYCEIDVHTCMHICYSFKLTINLKNTPIVVITILTYIKLNVIRILDGSQRGQLGLLKGNYYFFSVCLENTQTKFNNLLKTRYSL